MRDWWHNPTQVSQSLKLQARDAYIPANTIAVWNPGAHALNEDWLSTPVQGSVVPDNPVFFLSEADVYQRLGQTTNDLRLTNSIDADGNVGDSTHYWLRSVGLATSGVAHINHNGPWGWHYASNTFTTIAFRPTIWVHR